MYTVVTMCFFPVGGGRVDPWYDGRWLVDGWVTTQCLSPPPFTAFVVARVICFLRLAIMAKATRRESHRMILFLLSPVAGSVGS